MQVKHTHLCGFKATNDTFISRAKLFRKVGFGSIIKPGTDYYGKYVGFTVRCVAGGSGS